MLIVHEGKVIEHRHVSSPEINHIDLQLELSAPVENLSAILNALDTVTVSQITDVSASIKLHGDRVDQTELLKQLLNKNVPICALYEKKISLQESYLSQLEEKEF